jgi:hypothetical protein
MYSLEFYCQGDWVRLKHYTNLSPAKADFLLYVIGLGSEAFKTDKQFRKVLHD